MVTLSSADQTALFILALIVLLLIRRTIALYQGARYGNVRIFAYGGFSMVLFGYFAASTIYVAWSVWGPTALALLAPYLAIVALTAWFVRPIVERRVQFDTRPDGVYYRLPILIPVLYLVFFIARVSVEIGLFGLASIATFSIPSVVSTLDLVILIAFDLLFGASIGLLLGRGLGVRKAYESRPKPAEAPLASKPA